MVRVQLCGSCARFPEGPVSALKMPSVVRLERKQSTKLGVFSIASPREGCTRLATKRPRTPTSLAAAGVASGNAFIPSWWCNGRQHARNSRLLALAHITNGPSEDVAERSAELTTRRSRGQRSIIAWDLDNVQLRGPTGRAESLLRLVQQVSAALKPRDPLAEVEIHAFANHETLGQAWLSEHGLPLLQELGVQVHAAPTEDQAADTLLRQFVERAL
eukprot:CAMPEP_0118929134 /NCGR_PEP_ID=MMETSP1169-20130426/6221_1 /TAXON_ID=36882 /ORGANISM="Pyramimonas obovata, Strain CCMP722" /LENGTH=216 /DNA_ID=CAMNT_0006871267 /DNA_START=482 /DNA_END=1128 /DNA_ORIENTATION=-